MAIQNDFNIDCETFSAQIEAGAGVIKFKKHFLLRTADLMDRDAILECLDFFLTNDRVPGVILFGAPDSKGKAEYVAFFQRALNEGLDATRIHRMLNVVNQIILKLAGFKKPIVYANSGNVLPHFLSLGLVCDYSIFGEHTVIQNPCTEMGMVPVGGGAYLMTQALGRKKAMEVLVSKRDMTSREALALGLIDGIVGEDKLIDAAFEALKRFYCVPAGSMEGVKRLLQYSLKDLGDYLVFENEVFLNGIHASAFWKEGRFPEGPQEVSR